MNILRIDTNPILPVRLRDGEQVLFRFEQEVATGFECAWHTAYAYEDRQQVDAPCKRSLGCDTCEWCEHPETRFSRTSPRYCFLARTSDGQPVLVCFGQGKDTRRLHAVIAYNETHGSLQSGLFTLARSGTGLETQHVLFGTYTPEEAYALADSSMIADYLLRYAQQWERKRS